MTKWDFPQEGHMDKPSGIYFQNMTGKELDERLKESDLIIIPIGSTENHGANACPGEDTFLVTRIAELVAQKTGCTVAQPIWYGSHPFHHMGMPRTIMLDDDVFKAVLRAVMAGFWNSGFRKQILLNGHGQEYVIPSAIHQFAKKYQVPGVFINVNWYMTAPKMFMDKKHGGPFETPFIHADEVETSMSLALFPELIKQEYAIDNKPYLYLPQGHVDKAGCFYQLPIRWYDQVGCGPIEIAAYPEGVVGKPSLAAAKKAEKGIIDVLNYLEKLVNDIMDKFPPGALPPIEEITQRPPEEIEAVVKGALKKGGRSIYTLGYPP